LIEDAADQLKQLLLGVGLLDHRVRFETVRQIAIAAARHKDRWNGPLLKCHRHGFGGFIAQLHV
jgi:hypothetical protein